MQKSKKDLSKECAKLGIVVEEHRHSSEELQSFIANKQKGLINYYRSSEVKEGEAYPNETFQEIRVLRDKKSGLLEITDIVRKRICFSAREAAVINDMRLSNKENIVFTLFVRPGTSRIDYKKPLKLYKPNTSHDIRKIQPKFDNAANRGLLLEVVVAALQEMKVNPTMPPAVAFSIGFNEWVK